MSAVLAAPADDRRRSESSSSSSSAPSAASSSRSKMQDPGHGPDRPATDAPDAHVSRQDADKANCPSGPLSFLDRGITDIDDLHVSLFASSKPIPVHLSFATSLSSDEEERVLMSTTACRLCYRVCEAVRGRLPADPLHGILCAKDVQRLKNYARLLADGQILLSGSLLQERVSPTWILRVHGLFQAPHVCVYTCTVLIGEVKHIITFMLGHAGCQWAASSLMVA